MKCSICGKKIRQDDVVVRYEVLQIGASGVAVERTIDAGLACCGCVDRLKQHADQKDPVTQAVPA